MYEGFNVLSWARNLVYDLIALSKVLWQFFTEPLGNTVWQPARMIFQKIPIIRDIINFLINIFEVILPFSPLQLLSGVGLLVLVGLVIFKKLVPMA